MSPFVAVLWLSAKSWKSRLPPTVAQRTPNWLCGSLRNRESRATSSDSASIEIVDVRVAAHGSDDSVAQF
jgi:hypothetical protein